MTFDYTKQERTNSETFHCGEQRFGLERSDLHRLIALAESQSPRKRARLCAHESPSELVHQMFIVHPQTAYVRPHRHLSKSESMIVIDGQVDYMCFDDQGSLQEVVPMSSYETGQMFFYSIRAGQFHSIRIRSDWLVFFEVTQGPFDKHDIEYANWSPSQDQERAGLTFLDHRLTDRNNL